MGDYPLSSPFNQQLPYPQILGSQGYGCGAYAQGFQALAGGNRAISDPDYYCVERFYQASQRITSEIRDKNENNCIQEELDRIF